MPRGGLLYLGYLAGVGQNISQGIDLGLAYVLRGLVYDPTACLHLHGLRHGEAEGYGVTFRADHTGIREDDRQRTDLPLVEVGSDPPAA
jgi:hypothetical protein